MSGCQYIQQKKDVEANKPLARAGDSYLYNDDLSGLIPSNLSPSDSGKLTEKLINDWIKKELIVNKAEAEISIDQVEIERKTKAYKYALIVHEFEKLYINSHLEVNVDESEINNYYNEKSENFLLKQSIVRCLFAKIPKSSPDFNQIRRNMRNYPNTNKKDIQDYCYQFAVQSFLDDSLWVNFDELILNTPLMEVNNKTRFLSSTTYSETRDDDYIYLLKIMEYKISDQVSPLEYIREDIESIIINKRKLSLKKELEKVIYDEAFNTGSFEIYRD
jgi:hypothetical protein